MARVFEVNEAVTDLMERQEDPDNISLGIKYFGAVSEITGLSNEEWKTKHPMTTTVLRQQLTSKYDGLLGIRFRIAVNREICENDHSLSHQDEIALLPAFSGG